MGHPSFAVMTALLEGKGEFAFCFCGPGYAGFFAAFAFDFPGGSGWDEFHLCSLTPPLVDFSG